MFTVEIFYFPCNEPFTLSPYFYDMEFFEFVVLIIEVLSAKRGSRRISRNFSMAGSRPRCAQVQKDGCGFLPVAH
jgi:hypothetical protein